MADEVSLSVVVPTRNRHATLRRTLASLAAQTRSDLEVIVVDDASKEPANLAGSRCRQPRSDPLRGPRPGNGGKRPARRIVRPEPALARNDMVRQDLTTRPKGSCQALQPGAQE
jgi:cellulose synthase/poly-beta-1,6-N-acetylglucosamine synthase-like glycosyltransferase